MQAVHKRRENHQIERKDTGNSEEAATELPGPGETHSDRLEPIKKVRSLSAHKNSSERWRQGEIAKNSYGGEEDPFKGKVRPSSTSNETEKRPST